MHKLNIIVVGIAALGNRYNYRDKALLFQISILAIDHRNGGTHENIMAVNGV